MQLICCLSGKKRSGKNTAANYIAGKYLQYMRAITQFKIEKNGWLFVKMNNHWIEIHEGEFNNLFAEKSIKLYSFADPLKEFCMDVFGLTWEQCYGTDGQKNSRTNLSWSNMPDQKEYDGTTVAEFDPKMTAREVLQYFGTNVIRKMYGNAWVNATIAKIKKDGKRLAIITDARFPNEIEGVQQNGGLTIRLLRDVAGKDEHPSETALDGYPHESYSYIVDNKKHTIEEQNKILDPIIEEMFGKLRHEN
jgi:hypothetical protein